METVQLPKSARELLPDHALTQFNKWADLLAKLLSDNGESLKQREEAARQKVAECVSTHKELETEFSSDKLWREYTEILREAEWVHYKLRRPARYGTVGILPTRMSKRESSARLIRDAQINLREIVTKRKELEEAPNEIAKYMSWWDWFCSLDMQGMKNEILRLEGPKGKKTLERMLL